MATTDLINQSPEWYRALFRNFSGLCNLAFCICKEIGIFCPFCSPDNPIRLIRQAFIMRDLMKNQTMDGVTDKGLRSI